MSNIRSRPSSRGANGGGKPRNNSSGYRSNTNGRRNGGGQVSGGNARSTYDKYIERAKDALSSGDRVLAENFFQYADHYKRLIIEADAKKVDVVEKKVNVTESKNSEEASGSSSKTEEATDNSGASSGDGENKSGNIPKELAL